MKTAIWKILCGGMVLFAAFCLGNSSGICQQKPIEIVYSTHMPVHTGSTKLGEEWLKEIEKRTNGRVKGTMFSSATLLSVDKAYNGVLAGMADVIWFAIAYNKGRFPLSEIFELPTGIASGVQATRLVNEYLKKFKPKEFDDVKVMYMFGQSPIAFHSKKMIRNLEDFKGLKIRTGGSSAAIVKLMGATPVSMPINETYEAISRGVVDATTGSFDGLKDYRWAEVVKYSMESNGFGFAGAFGVFMNKGKWNSLPPDIQKIIEEINEQWSLREGKVFDDADIIAKEFSQSKGNQINRFSQEDAKKILVSLKPLYDEYVQRTKKVGLPGDEVLNFVTTRVKELQ
jgi:TRAP-type transport system periplasmic protein